MQSKIFAALVAILATFFLVNSLWSNPALQGGNDLCRISGEILDQSGAPLPRVFVEIRNNQGEVVFSTQTNSRGEFFLKLLSGRYFLTAELAGFAPLQNRPLEANSATLPLKLTLEIRSIKEQVMVTATKTDTPLSQIGSSVTLLSSQEISRKATASVAGALREAPGIALVQSGGVGQITSVFMRGGESDYTKIMVDGITLNNPGGGFNYANLSTSGIDRIEVVRGPQSALFGSDAIAGVIQIFTKQGVSEGLSPKPSIMVEGGTFSTGRYSAGLEGSSDRIDYTASFSRFDTDNNGFNNSFNNTTISGNLGFRPSKKTELRAVFRSVAGRAGNPGSWAFARPDPDEYFRRRDIAGALTFTHYATALWSQKLSYTINDSRQFTEDPSDSGEYVPQYKEYRAPYEIYDIVYQYLNETRRQKILYQSDLILPHGHLFTAGFDYEHETGVVGDPDYDPMKANRNNYGGYIQNQWALKNRLFTTAGVRFEHNGSFGFFPSPRISLALLARNPTGNRLWGLTKIKANFGLGIKAPTLAESFSNSQYVKGNPNLRPEKAVSFDVGIEQYFRSNRGLLELTYFWNRFRDQIGFEVTDYQTFAGSYFNIGKTRAQGLELALKSDLIWNLVLAGTYTFLDSEILESTSTFDPVFTKGQELFRRPRHAGHVDLSWRPGRWMLGATGIFVGSRVDSDFMSMGMTRNKGYSILNLLASYRLFNGTSIYLAVNNATNEDFMEILGYPALRANFRLGLQAGF